MSERGFKRAEWPGFRGPERDGRCGACGSRPTGSIAAGPDVAPADRAWLVVVRSSRQPALHPGAARRRRGRRVLHVTTGQPVGKHRDAARFWESHAGAGPRATPTLHDGRVYTFGPTGILNSLDADDGAVVWSRNVATDTGRRSRPGVSRVLRWWSTTSSSCGRRNARRLRLATGHRRWVGPAGGYGYSSPHLVTLEESLRSFC